MDITLRQWLKKATPSLSEFGETVWLDPSAIQFTISPSSDLVGTLGGDWDIERRYLLTRSVKHRAIVERYKCGARWEDTDLFLDVYARRLEHGQVRGCYSFKELLDQYYGRVDALFNSLKTEGFKTVDRRGRAVPLPGLLLGRDGDVFLNNQGNHRVAMAQVLGLDCIAGSIRCCHKVAPQWEDCRASLR